MTFVCVKTSLDAYYNKAVVIAQKNTEINLNVFKYYEVRRGVYITLRLNRYDIEDVLDVDKTSQFLFNHEAHGVCDTPEQAINHAEKFFGSENICLFLTKITRANQPKDGGWRWHKWGEYIGNHQPTAEYLYDESEIEHVYVFGIEFVRNVS